MAYAHNKQKHLYLLVLGGTPGLHAVTTLNAQTLLQMVWKVLLTS